MSRRLSCQKSFPLCQCLTCLNDHRVSACCIKHNHDCHDSTSCSEYIPEDTNIITDLLNEARELCDIVEKLQEELEVAIREVCNRCPDGNVIDGIKHYPCEGCKWRRSVQETEKCEPE